MGLEDRTPAAPEPGDAAALRHRIAAAVRERRARSGRSLAEVAATAGIGKSTLHAIEAGHANPGIETLWALARALDVPFGQLLDPPAPSVRVVRAGTAPMVVDESSSMHAWLLASTSHGASIEVYDLHLEPGPDRDADAHSSGTIEHVLVTAGRLLVGPREATVELGVGDLATFAGDTPHRYVALAPATRAVLLIEYP